MSERIVAFCGLLCNECPAFNAKKTDDDELRKKTVGEWSSDDFPLNLEDINCDGCITEGQVFKHCTVCEVRKCGSEKGVVNCAYCADYPCGKLEGLWNYMQVTQAKQTLDEIRKTV